MGRPVILLACNANFLTGGTAKPVSSHKPKPLKAIHNLLSLPTSLTSTSRFSMSSNISRKSIKFYNRDEPYYEFTNFYPASVVIDGQCWPSTEHYFQAQKFVGTPYLEMIRGFSSAREAFQLSRDPTVSLWRRSDWDTVKDDIMLKALRCKFAQHSDLRKMLWKTGDKELIEHTTNDSYWADGGGHGKGQNKLGKLLMKVRDDINAVCGPCQTSSELPHSSSLTKWGTNLKRSSSSSDSTGHIPKRPNSVPENNDVLSSRLQGTTLKTPPKSKLRCSSSLSRMPNSGNYNERGVSNSSLRGIASRDTSLHTSAQSSKSYVQSSFLCYLPKSGASIVTQGKGAIPQRFYSSSTSSVTSRPAHMMESRNPITGGKWY